jgi:hypothetical protein
MTTEAIPSNADHSNANLPNAKQGNIGRSIAAVLAGFVVVAALSLVTDEIFHLLKVYPPWGEPMRAPGANALALAYRTIYSVLGGYVTAMIAPRNPVKHAVILGSIGLVISILGVIVTLPLNLGPAWYPIGLAVTSLPCSWLGGFLYSRKSVS